MLDIQSIVIYLGMALIAFVIAVYAEQCNSKKAVWLIIILLSLLSGLRAVSVGIDTKTYDNVFSFISHGNIKELYGLEESFIYICAGLLKIWDNHQFLFLLFALTSHGLILLRFWQDKEYISFRWSVLTYYITFFAFSLNGMRQFVAVAIVVYATSYLKKGKYFKYTVTMLVAVLFHTSAIIGFSYIFFEILFAKYYNQKRKIRIFLLCGLMAVAGLAIVDSFFMKYINYFDRQATSIGLMMFVKFGTIVFSLFFIKESYEEKKHIWSIYTWYYAIGLLLNSLSYFFLYTGRIGLYFYIFEALFIGKIFKEKNRSIWIILIKFIYFVLMMYYLFEVVTKNGQGHLPYRFFWQGQEGF